MKNVQAQRALDAQQKAQQEQASSLSRAYQAARTAAQQRSQQAREQAVKLATPGRVNMPTPRPVAQPVTQPVQQPQQIQRAQEIIQAMPPPVTQPVQQPQQIQRAQEVVQAMPPLGQPIQQPAPFELPEVPVMSKTVPGATPGYGGSNPLSQDVTPIQVTPDGNVYDPQGNFMYNMNTGERAAPPQPAPAADPFAQYGAYADRLRADFETAKQNRYRNEVNDAYYATPDRFLEYAPGTVNQWKYQDWVKANRPEAVANNYGMNYAERIGPEQQAYSDYIRSQNQNVYDQYAQYQNKAFNDYYTANPKGSQGFDVYNPLSFSNMIQNTAIAMPGQDVLGAFTPPRPQRQPGIGFNEWYTSTYNKPGYQQLGPVQRMNVDFGGFGGFGQTPSEPVLTVLPTQNQGFSGFSAGMVPTGFQGPPPGSSTTQWNQNPTTGQYESYNPQQTGVMSLAAPLAAPGRMLPGGMFDASGMSDQQIAGLGLPPGTTYFAGGSA
jgi:hypothetical protein